ncbi:hypothetical protein [Chitinophaga sp. sic0106]|uniref:hypothetical protein n=1 Tax=Chitinophaga sp. sic0106 TaxID=2854785 RepID=UPI001C48284F|nr:hypothetical protein [Chitinophaga sp. sic0106]MBV7529845.1 hypothetical protein [Chitinophaga sp. sic0106]
MHQLLQHIVGQPHLHARWLNTLSFMENAGARKISGCEHPTSVDLIQLKHAAEEHRHAYYLKKQILKLDAQLCKTYLPHELLAATHTRHYLHQLDMRTSRYLKQQFGLAGQALKNAAYLFVTYAIEVRADELYPVYQQALDEANSKVMVRSIIVEEEGHLEEMISQLKLFSPDWEAHALHIQELEKGLFVKWLVAIEEELNIYA